MDAKKCLKTRRSIRSFLDKDVSKKTIEELIDCARSAPSSHNDQPWEFVSIREEETKKELSELHKWAHFVKEAPVVVAVGYDTEKSEYEPSAMLSTAAAIENLLLGAHAEGLGACWVYIKDEDDDEIEKEAKDILAASDNIEILCLVPIGYTNQDSGNKDLRAIEEITHSGQFS